MSSMKSDPGIPLKIAAVQKCAQCGRANCPLLADVIVGQSNWFSATGDCYRARASRKVRNG